MFVPKILKLNVGRISLRDFWLVEKLFGMFAMDSSLVSGLPDHFFV